MKQNLIYRVTNKGKGVLNLTAEDLQKITPTKLSELEHDVSDLLGIALGNADMIDASNGTYVPKYNATIISAYEEHLIFVDYPDEGTTVLRLSDNFLNSLSSIATNGLKVQDENGVDKFTVDEYVRFDSSFFTFQTLSKTLSLKQEGATKVVSERDTSNIRTVWMDIRGKRVAYGGSGGIKSASLSEPFNLSTYGNETVIGNGAVKTLEFNQDGTKLVILESTGSATYSRYRTYELTTSFDLSTATSIATKGLTSVTLEGVATSPKTVSFLLSPDGTKIYQHFSGNILAEATMSTPYDVSTIGDFTSILTYNYGRNTADMTFAKNGHELYVSMINTNVSSNLCFKWFLPTPYDLSVMKQIGWSTNFNTTNLGISASTLYPYFLRKVAGQTANNKLEIVRLNYEF